MDPSLTPDQRLSIIRKHVAIRNRAAAYGVLKHELKKARADLAAAQEKLKQFESSVPATGVVVQPSSNTGATRASDQVFDALRRMAKR